MQDLAHEILRQASAARRHEVTVHARRARVHHDTLRDVVAYHFHRVRRLDPSRAFAVERHDEVVDPDDLESGAADVHRRPRTDATWTTLAVVADAETAVDLLVADAWWIVAATGACIAETTSHSLVCRALRNHT